MRMPRTRDPATLGRVSDAATELFIRRGYRGTHIGAVADLAGIAPGTVYLYARDKASLFDLVMRRALHDPAVDTMALPYATPRPERLVADLWDRFRPHARFPVLEEALERDAPADVAREFEDIVRELYDWLFRYWKGLKIIERCARDWPELHAMFYRQFRRRGITQLARYLERRTAAGRIRQMPDVPTAARAILEQCAFFAMHRHTAPDSADLTDAHAEATTVLLLKRAFLTT
jgi:AcrR family transcriptional regulator